MRYIRVWWISAATMLTCHYVSGFWLNTSIWRTASGDFSSSRKRGQFLACVLLLSGVLAIPLLSWSYQRVLPAWLLLELSLSKAWNCLSCKGTSGWSRDGSRDVLYFRCTTGVERGCRRVEGEGRSSVNLLSSQHAGRRGTLDNGILVLV